jgi:hypothetical protein
MIDFTNFTLDSLKALTSGDFLQTLGGFLALPLVYYALQCFAGYRFFRIKCAITGFTSGAALGLLIASALNLGTGWSVAIPIALGLIFALCSYKYYKFGVFFMSAVTGFTLGFALFGAIFGLVIALIVGIVAVFLTKPSIIVTTAFSGGMGLSTCLLAILNVQNDVILTLAGLALCAVGILVQFKTTKKL